MNKYVIKDEALCRFWSILKGELKNKKKFKDLINKMDDNFIIDNEKGQIEIITKDQSKFITLNK